MCIRDRHLVDELPHKRNKKLTAVRESSWKVRQNEIEVKQTQRLENMHEK